MVGASTSTWPRTWEPDWFPERSRMATQGTEIVVQPGESPAYVMECLEVWGGKLRIASWCIPQRHRIGEGDLCLPG